MEVLRVSALNNVPVNSFFDQFPNLRGFGCTAVILSANIDWLKATDRKIMDFTAEIRNELTEDLCSLPNSLHERGFYQNVEILQHGLTNNNHLASLKGLNSFKIGLLDTITLNWDEMAKNLKNVERFWIFYMYYDKPSSAMVSFIRHSVKIKHIKMGSLYWNHKKDSAGT